jgi:four helix bundle protein
MAQGAVVKDNFLNLLEKGDKMGNFQDLKVWHQSKELAILIYKITRDGPIVKDYGFKDQIRRSALSVPSNIAEGDELGTDRQSIKFFYIAKGSIGELLTQSIIAYEVGYLSIEQFEQIQKECRIISSMLTKLIQARSKTTS